MTDFLTYAYLNIDNFSYPKNIEKIEANDMIIQNKTRKKLFYYSPVIFCLGLVVSKYSKQLKGLLKQRFIENGNKEYFPSLKQNIEIKEVLINNINQETNEEKVKKETVINQVGRKKDYLKSVLPEKFNNQLKDSKNLNLKSKSKLLSEQEIKLSKLNTKNREMFDFSSENSKGNRLMSLFLKSSLLWFPIFTIIAIFSYDYFTTNFGFYLKYQPLVDSYYENENKLSKEKTEKI